MSQNTSKGNISRENISLGVDLAAKDLLNRRNSEKSQRNDSQPVIAEKTPKIKRYRNKHMKQFPELYRSDVSIYPSYTGLKNLPYYVVCRRRLQKTRKMITNQLNREIMHMAMIQPYALGSVRVDRMFSVGFPPEAIIIPDVVTDKERRRINNLISDR